MSGININEIFKEWCKDTCRSGGILTGKSIKEFIDSFQMEVDDYIEDTLTKYYFENLSEEELKDTLPE